MSHYEIKHQATDTDGPYSVIKVYDHSSPVPVQSFLSRREAFAFMEWITNHGEAK